ncbi:MAG: hypothetical protein ABIT01_07055 [Thermoanaerobaculia bacterium]
MAKRIEPSRKSPADRLQDLLLGHAEAAGSGPASAVKYLERTLGSSGSLPNAVKFFAYALLVEAASGVKTPESEETALAALADAEHYLPVAQEEIPREWQTRREQLKFLEVGIALRSDRAEFDEALRLCDLALALGYGSAFSSKRNSILRMT